MPLAVIMGSRLSSNLVLTERMTIRWSEGDMITLKRFAAELGITTNEVVRNTVRNALMDIHYTMIPFYPPTRQINDEINRMVTESGMTRPQVTANILTYHLNMLKVNVGDEELYAMLKGQMDICMEHIKARQTSDSSQSSPSSRDPHEDGSPPAPSP